MLTHAPVPSSETIDQLVEETMPLGYIVWDSEGNGLHCSARVVQLFGLQTSQDVFDNWERLSPPIQPTDNSTAECYFDKIFSLVNASDQILSEWWHQTIHGAPILVEAHCMRHRTNGKDFFIAYLRDQHDRKQSRQEHAVGHLRFISILRSCPICFAILSGDRFAFVTPFMSNVLGVKIGDTFSSLIADPKMMEKLSQESREDEIVSWLSVPIRTPYGEDKEMLVYSLYFDDSEHSERIIWLLDVTQSRKLERELKTAKESAEAATKAKSAFLANMSHEIRTPMNAIIGLTHLTLQTSLTEQQAEYIETVQQSAQILLRLINDILDFSKIESGRMILEYRRFTIGSIISEIAAVVSLPVKEKNLNFQVEVDENLPPTVMGDSVRLHQVLLNLLTNAIKFTASGMILLKIDVVETDMLSIIIRFSVTDSGIGMTPIQIKGLFEPFAQASASTTRQFGGTGLGLAISKQIVELMHGEISCQSEPGKGTTFTFFARFGIPLEGEVVTVDDSTEIRTDALLVGDCPHDQATVRHYIELLESHVYQVGAELAEFQNILETGKIRDIDFIIFDFSDLRKNFIPFYALMRDKQLDPMPLCVVTEHPELESVLNELEIKDSIHVLKKPMIASDLFNIVAIVTDLKKQTLREQEVSGIQSQSSASWDIVIPKSIRGAAILLVEDNKINQMVAKELLKVKEFEITTADNGRIAIELLQKQQFDLVLMDIQMPEMDGFEATRTIRSDPHFAQIPILAMTANAMSGDRELALDAGMNDHIAKPIDPKTLYKALVKWIRK